MTVDVKKLKKGQKVLVEMEFSGLSTNPSDRFPVRVKGGDGDISWVCNTAVKEISFSWDDVKPGMAFLINPQSAEPTVVWFLCEYHSGWVFTADYNDPWKVLPTTFIKVDNNPNIIAAPKYDIEVTG